MPTASADRLLHPVAYKRWMRLAMAKSPFHERMHLPFSTIRLKRPALINSTKSAGFTAGPKARRDVAELLTRDTSYSRGRSRALNAADLDHLNGTTLDELLHFLVGQAIAGAIEPDDFG